MVKAEQAGNLPCGPHIAVDKHVFLLSVLGGSQKHIRRQYRSGDTDTAAVL